MDDLPNTPPTRGARKTMIIGTVSGGYIDLLNPENHTVTLEDIYTGLRHTARWAGQTTSRWSVEEHSVMCANAFRGPAVGSLACLTHDIAEAVTGDIPNPIKKHLRVQVEEGGPFLDFETAVELPVRRALLRVLFPDARLRAAVNEQLDAGVYKPIDLVALHAEATRLRPRTDTSSYTKLPDGPDTQQALQDCTWVGFAGGLDTFEGTQAWFVEDADEELDTFEGTLKWFVEDADEELRL